MLVEIACQSVADAWNAQAGGANRIELCCALPLGGLTPTHGLLSSVKLNCSLPVMAIVRLRAGGFVYSPAEVAIMEQDAALLRDRGADGIVFGCLTEDGDVDDIACRRLIAAAGGKQTIFHRAFDCARDPFAALDTLISLGVTRVLTSGMAPTAADGLETLAALQERAAGRIEILPGGGVRAHNVRALIEKTGVNQVHLAPLIPVTSTIPFDFGTHTVIDSAAVRAIVQALA